MTGRASRVLGLLTLVVYPAGLHAQPRPPDSVRTAAARVRAAVDAIAEPARQRRQLAGMVVLAIRAGDTLLHRAYGLAEVENGVPLTTGHVFQLASITKQFTAAAVLRLAGEGRVDLEASITRYLPDAPTQGHPITVRQLLTHTSGIPDYAESPRIRTLKRLDLPPDSLVGLVRGTPLYFAPGDQMRYSNTGFVLLGQLIERVTRMPYHTYVEEHLLRPMGAT
ncbi:MAG TPA: serine hydrolase domain-containing protein, partial [Gemmatimonadales bacterium]|nr:serine hydrolase domain-containing protein [Gemmatimonadales bacterium]